MTRFLPRATARLLAPIVVAGGLALGVAAPAAATGTDAYQYLSPLPGALRVSPRNDVVIRDGRLIDPATLAADRVSVVGSVSGAHAGTLALSDDGRTLVFQPATPYTGGEQVEVSLGAGILAADGAPLPALSFGFTVSTVDPALQPHPDLVAEWPDWQAEATAKGAAIAPETTPIPWPCAALPPSYPSAHVTYANGADDGYTFLTPFTVVNPGRLMIVDNLDQPIFYRQLATSAHNLFLQADGRLTYFDRSPPGGGTSKYFALDSSYTVVDSFAVGNGYITDSHDLVLLPNGHALLMANDPEPVDMSVVVPGGNPDAIVTGLIIQEIDAAKNVVFQWRSWDHFQITDCVSPTQDLLGDLIDYVHGNGLELDGDGNILLSSRHLNEITKIDRQTGAIIWRWGPHAKNNQFTTIGDTRGFSHQHDLHRLPNGHFTIFDNGNYVYPQYSRALEFAVDENTKTATLVWSYRASPDIFSSFLGSVQRRPDGSTMIAWGGAGTNPKVTDLAPDGTVTFAMSMPRRLWTYRAFRFPWRTNLLRTDVTALNFGEVGIGSGVQRTLNVRNDGRADVTIGCVVVSNPAFTTDTFIPVTLPPGGMLAVNVTFHPTLLQPYSGKVYLRVVTDTDLIAQDVAVSGTGVINQPPDCSNARASVSVLWPPDHRLVPVTVEGVTDPDGDPVTISVDAITQDEPVGDGLGDGDTCPDAVNDGGSFELRAERSALGNGRVYRVAFTARDGRGGECHGTVGVCVPHDVGDGDPKDAAATCVDDGQTENALARCLGHRGDLHAAAESAVDVLALTGAPAAGATGTVDWTLPTEARMRLSVFDPAGRRVATLARGRMQAGAHRLEWSTAGLAPGVYFYRLRAGAESVSRAFAIIR